MRRVSSRLALLAALAISVLGFATVGAVAKTPGKSKTVIVTGGNTAITASSKTASFLVSHGIVVSAVAPATQTGTTITLPVKGGVAKVKSLDGALLHRGAVKFATTTKSVTVRHLTLFKLGKRAHFAGTVGSKTVRLGNITGLKAMVSGKTATVKGVIHLTASAAAMINKLVGKHVVSAGYVLGTFTSTLTIK